MRSLRRRFGTKEEAIASARARLAQGEKNVIVMAAEGNYRVDRGEYTDYIVHAPGKQPINPQVYQIWPE